MEKINFSKFNGQGNDFIIIDSLKFAQKISRKQVAKLCNRHFGIGADGLILVKKSPEGNFFMDYYNADGSIAEICGNGIRCMASFLVEKGFVSSGSIPIETRAGLKLVTYKGNRNGKAVLKVNMGEPIFEPGRIPVNIDNGNLLKGFFAAEIKLNIEGRVFKVNCVSMGNPHCVIFLEDKQELETIPLDVWGPKIENHGIFPKKTNVEFVKIKNDQNLSMRVWERGVGETPACGTGACASAVCSIILNKTKKGKTSVSLPGGKVNIYWQGIGHPVFLEGTVEHVFDGEFSF